MRLCLYPEPVLSPRVAASCRPLVRTTHAVGIDVCATALPQMLTRQPVEGKGTVVAEAAGVVAEAEVAGAMAQPSCHQVLED